jgi:lambda family phage portal protein
MGWFSRIFGGQEKAPQEGSFFRPADGDRRDALREDPLPPGPWNARRWDSGQPANRTDRAHWRYAQEVNINADLNTELPVLRARAVYEASSNPDVEGVIKTHQDDLIGRHGPTLQLLSSSERYNRKGMASWKDWWKQPCANRRLSGVALLRLWIRDCWTSGELTTQKITRRDRPGPCQMRLLPFHPRRMYTPPYELGNPAVALGVRHDPDWDPLTYYVMEPWIFGPWEVYTGKFFEIPAKDFVHWFVMLEADQVRGVPWLASALEAIGQMREYDDDVLDAARQAAMSGVYWYTTHPDAELWKRPSHGTMERGTQRTGPPGWTPSMMTPTQPSTKYVEYRMERQRQIGRPVNMPLMTIRQDSSKHNYSSARFDAECYWRGNECFQWALGSDVLTPIAEEVLRECELAGVLPRRPDDLEFRWKWPPRPRVDRYKEAMGERAEMENGTLTYEDALSAQGLDEDQVIASRKKTAKKLADAGLPPVATPSAKAPGSPGDLVQGDQNAPAGAGKKAKGKPRANGVARFAHNRNGDRS